MPTFTPNFNLAKPVVTGDVDTWGGFLNGNLDVIDTTLQTLTTGLSTANATLATAVQSGANLGAGTALFSSKSGTALQFRTLVAGANVTFATDANTVTINAAGGGGGGATWGAIIGTLSNQTDLQTALNGKANTSHTHTAGDVTSGVFASARLGTGTANSTTFLRGDGQWATPSVSLTWGSITGTLSSQTDLQTALNGKANTSHTHAAGDIVSGTFDPARLATGTPNSSTFVRGDGQWASPPAPAWGAIIGTLSNQTDLQTALNGKANVASPDFSGSPTVSSNRIHHDGNEPRTFVQATTPTAGKTGDLWAW
jgi:hypothetical protein